MQIGAITGYIDVAQVTLYAFWFFFAGLVFYLRREDRREGYPLESDVTGERGGGQLLFIPPPKTFLLGNGHTVQAPDPARDDRRRLNARRTAAWNGAPIEPVGDPMLAAVGPGSYAERADVPDVTTHGEALIVPLREVPEYGIADGDPDPRGWAVSGADGPVVGQVVELWFDRADKLFRYFEVELTGSGRRVLVPLLFGNLHKKARLLRVPAILSRHFADVPAHAVADRVTLLEEDRIMGYFGGGLLYATPQRTESQL